MQPPPQTERRPGQEAIATELSTEACNRTLYTLHAPIIREGGNTTKHIYKDIALVTMATCYLGYPKGRSPW